MNLIMRNATITAVAVLALTCTFAGNAADPPGAEWTRFWDAGDGMSATGGLAAVAPDGSVYVVSSTGDAEQDLVLLKYDPTGRLLWATTYDGPGSGDDVATDIEITGEGVSIVGTSPGLEGPQTVLLDFDVNGEIIGEQRTIGPTIAGFLRPQLAIGADGRRVLATDDDNGVGVVAGFTAEGETIFETEFMFEGFSGFSALEIDDALNVIAVTVESFSAYVVRKLDPTGTEQWSHHETSETGLVLSDAFIAITSNSEIVIVGSPEINCVTVKARVWRHAADGEVLWRRDLPENECDFGIAVGLEAGPEGEVYLAAAGEFPTSLLARLDANGEVNWTQTVGGEGLNIIFADLVVTPGGSVIVGASQSPENDIAAYDILVQCYDATGKLGWSSVFDGPDGEADLIGGVAAGADGTVAVAGTVRYLDEFQNVVTRGFTPGPECAADLDGDGIVGTGDLLMLLGAWGRNPGHAADLNDDGVVGAADLVLLLGAWGPCA